MEKTFRVGIIGAGMMGKLHTEAIRRIPGVEVVALADPNQETAERVCREMFIPNAFTSASEMIAQASLDAVHVCTPNFAHYPVCKEAILAGINVYCEKPLANTSEQTEDLCRLAREKGVTTAVNFNYRHNAIVRDMHERVLDQSWGRTFLVHGHYIQDWMMYEDDYNWRCVPELGGASRTVADIGSHWFDTVQFVTGRKIVRVFAKLITVIDHRKKFTTQAATFGKQTGEEYELIKIDSEDAAFILVEFDNGVLGNLVLSQVSGGHKNDFTVDIDGSCYSMSWRQEQPDQLLVGDRNVGTTLIRAAADTLHGDAVSYAALPGGHPVAWNDALKNAIASFYTYLRSGGERRFANFEDGDQIVRIVEACLRSNVSQQWEEVQ